MSPGDFQHVYSLPASGTRSQTVAIVNPYGAPTIASDLRKFSSQFGLPQCTTSSGCLRVLNEAGGSSGLPAANGDWPAEAALGVETVHGICNSCHIILIEASSATVSDLTASVDTAARLGANEISISFVTSESFDDSFWAPHYNHPGVVIVAASGDHGYDAAPAFPASLPTVVAAGGTSLKLTGNGSYRSESVWNSSGMATGSGCSSLFAAPPWQAADAARAGCGAHRAVSDVSADADPVTGAAVYTATPIPGQSGEKGWFQIGGTSLSAPLIAGVFALAGGTPSDVSPAATLYARHGMLHDVTSGSNGQCGGTAICEARPGYDGPTGLGTPNGLGAFYPPGAAPTALDPHHPGVSLAPARIRTSSPASLHLSLLNRNPFRVNGSVSLESVARLHYPTSHSRAIIVSFGRRTFHLGARGATTTTFTLSPNLRSLVARLRQIKLAATIEVSDAAGHRGTVRAQLALDYVPPR